MTVSDDETPDDGVGGELVHFDPDRPRCSSVAWHGEQCKNRSRAGQTTCAWHDPGYADKMRDSRVDPAPDDPTKWNFRCRGQVSQPDGVQRQCNQNAVRGLEFCRHHGGSHPAARQVGERVMEDRIRQHRLKQMAEKYGLAVGEEVNPLEELQGLIRECTALKDFLFEKVTELDEITYTDRIGVENVRQVMAMYERALERTGRILVDTGKLDIDNRLAKVTERQADLVATVLERVLTKMELGEDRREVVKGYLSEEFRKLELEQPATAS